MCDKSIVLSLFFILKIVAIIVVPLLILFYKRMSDKLFFRIFYIDLIVIGLFIVLRLFNSSCIVNSTIGKIDINISKNTKEKVVEKNDPSEVNKIVTNKIYKTNDMSDVYYFNNNSLPLSDKAIVCGGKDLYMKQYGNGITTVSMLVSTVLNQNIDPIEILNLAQEKGIFDCTSGVNIDLLLNAVSEKYNISIYQIGIDDLWSTVNSGKVVIEEVVYNRNSESNLTCNKSYILVYKVDSNGQFQILNPNDTDYDYICSDNSVGAFDLIYGNSNDKAWNIYDLKDLASRFIVGERN